MRRLSGERGWTAIDSIIALLVGLLAIVPVAEAASRCLKAGGKTVKAAAAAIDSRNAETEAYEKLFSF